MERDYYVVLFNSRQKDNANVENFISRRKMFLTTDLYDSVYIQKKFSDFVKDGVPGELCRMYYSINSRDHEKIRKNLMHNLIDETNMNFASIESIIVSIAAKSECAKTKRWMFDFDIDNPDKVKQFCEDIKRISKSEIDVEEHKTPHGYAVIVSHGFDTRELYKIWDPALTECKKDDLLCVRWEYSK